MGALRACQLVLKESVPSDKLTALKAPLVNRDDDEERFDSSHFALKESAPFDKLTVCLKGERFDSSHFALKESAPFDKLTGCLKGERPF